MSLNTEAVDPVLRLLYQSGVGISPTGIVANLDERMDDSPSRPVVLEAIEDLLQEDYVRPLNTVEACYVITESGRDYVESELDDEAMGFH